MLFLQGFDHHAEGVLGLPVGEQVEAVLPGGGHTEPGLVGPGQGGERVEHPGQVRGPVVGQGELHPEDQRADGQLPAAHPGGQQRLDPRRDLRAVEDVL
jgi:hypothetical protein